MQWRLKFESRIKRNVVQLNELIEEKMRLMYSRLDESNIFDEECKHMASQKYSVNEDYYLDKYIKTITRAKSFNIWSF